MDEKQIMARVHELVAEEHALRERHRAGQLDDAEERARLRELEETLDQHWDLLRQRRARASAGQDPDAAETRPVSEVEGYLQ